MKKDKHCDYNSNIENSKYETYEKIWWNNFHFIKNLKLLTIETDLINLFDIFDLNKDKQLDVTELHNGAIKYAEDLKRKDARWLLDRYQADDRKPKTKKTDGAQKDSNIITIRVGEFLPLFRALLQEIGYE